MKLSEFIEMIRNGTIKPFNEITLYFKESYEKDWKKIHWKIREMEWDRDVDETWLNIADIEEAFGWTNHLKETHKQQPKHFRENMIKFLTEMNEICPIDEIFLSGYIQFTGED